MNVYIGCLTSLEWLEISQNQFSMFEALNVEEEWRKEWKDMPEFVIGDTEPFQTVKVHFRSREDRKNFEKLLDRKMTDQTQYIWYPENEEDTTEDTSEEVTTKLPKYPVYIISKGRWQSRLTSKVLDRMKVPYHIVIEPQEYEQYAAVIDPAKIFVLPFSNLNQGGIPARNWVWEHSISLGAERHWILDDNIEAFNRLNRNKKPIVETGTIFKAAEDFVSRYENIAIAGFNYYSFCKTTEQVPPYYLNTRIYSCILIKNDLPYRWRGRYNEDTDLSLRALKDGWCTVLFNAFLCGKIARQSKTVGILAFGFLQR